MEKRSFLMLCAVNIALLLLYVTADLSEWVALRGFNGDVASVGWDPIQIWLSYGSRIDGALVDGLIRIHNYSFMIVLAIVVIDLVAVWRIAHSAR